jgi:hypothetical protein
LNVILSDVLTLTNDYLGNASTGTIDDSMRIRAINRSVEYIKRNLSIPGDETTQTIWYSQDQFFYDLDTDVDELLTLRYADERLNNNASRFEPTPYPEILQRSGMDKRNQFGITHINGAKQIVISGYNRYGGVTIDEISAVGDWTDEADASGIALDVDQAYDTNGSLSFDISNSTGTAALQDATVSLDIDSLRQRHGFVKLRTRLSSANIDGMALKLYTDDSNYYTITVTETDAGEDFTANEWLLIGFAMDDAVATGSPTDTDINKIRVEWDLGSGFTTATDFRMDTIYTIIPDELELTFYSNYKGTNAAGTSIQTLSTTSDILSISGHGEDLIDVIAQRAAISLWPQQQGDQNALMELKRDFRENMKGYAKRWPRKRTQQGGLRTRLVR